MKAQKLSELKQGDKFKYGIQRDDIVFVRLQQFVAVDGLGDIWVHNTKDHTAERWQGYSLVYKEN